MLMTSGRLSLAVLIAAAASTAYAADAYTVDPVHSSVSFAVSHVGISEIHGRFDDVAGKLTIDKDDPSKSKFELSIKTDSVNTNNKMRDEHLHSPDFFNTKQFPTLTFTSTKVKKMDGGYEVTGDLTLHGVTKPVTFTLKGGDKTVEFPKGKQRLGFTTTLTIKRSDFDMKNMLEAIGDDVHISIGVEGVK